MIKIIKHTLITQNDHLEFFKKNYIYQGL